MNYYHILYQKKWNIKSPVNALNAANAADICIVLTLTLQQILR